VPLTIRADRFSEVAKQKIIAAGGTAEEQAT
jgi:ribosomal protein L15